MAVDDIAPEIREFVDRFIDQFIAWDLLVYFHEHPGVERKCAGVAMDIGRRPAAVEPTLTSLARKGILAGESDESGDTVYRYVAGADFRGSMSAFLSATRDRATRLAIVSRVLQNETRNT